MSDILILRSAVCDLKHERKFFMALMIRLEQGKIDCCPDGDFELINGVVYPKIQETEKMVEAVRFLYESYDHYHLNYKPLDSIVKPQTEFYLPNMENTVLKPEIAVVLNGEELPGWIVEFQDPETEIIACQLKPALYYEAGVKEYWVVDMEREQVMIYNFEKNGFIPMVVDSPRRIPVGIYRGFFVNYSGLFKKKK